MGRLLVLALLLYILWMAVGNFMQKLRSAVSSGALRQPPPTRTVRSAASPPTPEVLLPCAACGTFVPASRAVAGKGAEVFCSEACRKLNAE